MLLPNQLTVLRIILTPIFFWLFISDSILNKQISLLIYFIAAITDWYDGWLARKFNYITNWGKFLDPLADKILVTAAFFAFVYIGALDIWLVIIMAVRDFFVTGLRAYAEFRGMGMATSKLAKWKTFIQMSFIYYLLLIFTLKTVDSIYVGREEYFRVLMNQDFIDWTMIATTLITVYTGIQYFFVNRRILQRSRNENKPF